MTFLTIVLLSSLLFAARARLARSIGVTREHASAD